MCAVMSAVELGGDCPTGRGGELDRAGKSVMADGGGAVGIKQCMGPMGGEGI